MSGILQNTEGSLYRLHSVLLDLGLNRWWDTLREWEGTPGRMNSMCKGTKASHKYLGNSLKMSWGQSLWYAWTSDGDWAGLTPVTYIQRVSLIPYKEKLMLMSGSHIASWLSEMKIPCSSRIHEVFKFMCNKVSENQTVLHSLFAD